MKRLMLFVGFALSIFAVCPAGAQSLNTMSVNSAGIKMSQNSGSLSLTVGDLVCDQQEDSSGNSLNGGVINSAVVSFTLLSEKASGSDGTMVRLFPNPSSDWLNIEFVGDPVKSVLIEIFNLKGQVVLSQYFPVTYNVVGIDSSKLTAGSYLVRVRELNSTLSDSYRLVKVDFK